MKMNGRAFGLRRTLHRAGLAVMLAFLAAYICFFIANGPRDSVSVTLAICFAACCFLVVLTSEVKER
ncbi:hypothetical protein HY768_02750 [candidate division TA06 bacterium]|uniref:Uncharacterized protein n=1 Tax=candidate division TA06 bacterium TaxID=2250710 RepID=A0A933MJN0_UNCT6|nr:hypothetical protein [candidate division TA06 bacterium]